MGLIGPADAPFELLRCWASTSPTIDVVPAPWGTAFRRFSDTRSARQPHASPRRDRMRVFGGRSVVGFRSPRRVGGSERVWGPVLRGLWAGLATWTCWRPCCCRPRALRRVRALAAGSPTGLRALRMTRSRHAFRCPWCGGTCWQPYRSPYASMNSRYSTSSQRTSSPPAPNRTVPSASKTNSPLVGSRATVRARNRSCASG